ncbi:universal stress protein [Streptomyces sp. NPDC057280]|uniref:universal stress protein n=1 Tax=Streptomyces sp. NPDC057280 TaxID=3346081 RepID=UPI003624C517
MPRPVVVGLDGSRESLAAADWAAREALRRGLTLRLVHAWEGGTSAGEPGLPELAAPRYWSQRILRGGLDRLGESYPQVRLSADQVPNSAPDALVAAADEAELLVLGSRAFSGFGGFMAGSAALATVARATRPVVLVRAHQRLESEHLPDADGRPSVGTPYREVMVGVDPAHRCEELLAFAFESAMMRAAPLRAVCTWRLPYMPAAAEAKARKAVGRDAEHALRTVLEPWRGKFPTVVVHELVLEGRPAVQLTQAAADAGLLVVGRKVRPARIGTHTGPVAHAVMHHVRCPVAVVPHA